MIIADDADHTNEAARLAAALIDIPSVTGDEAEVLCFLEDRCRDLGLETEREPVSERRWNLYAGWSGIPDVVLSTHVDTVPPHIPARIEGDVLYGRGACDTKGIIAAMLLAGRELRRKDHSPAFLFVVGEETDSLGAKTAAASGRKARHIIVGEPTDNMLVSGHKGVLSYTLTTTGVPVHSAYPERGSSAVHLLLDLLQEIRSASWGSHEVLGEATTNIGLIHGGIAMNTTAPEATATIMHRIVDDPAQRERQLRELIRDRAEILVHSRSQPQLLHVVPGFESRAVSFGTDIPYLNAMGRCLLFGPGSVHDAHTPEEKILISDIEDAARSYIELFLALRTT